MVHFKHCYSHQPISKSAFPFNPALFLSCRVYTRVSTLVHRCFVTQTAFLISRLFPAISSSSTTPWSRPIKRALKPTGSSSKEAAVTWCPLRLHQILLKAHLLNPSRVIPKAIGEWFPRWCQALQTHPPHIWDKWGNAKTSAPHRWKHQKNLLSVAQIHWGAKSPSGSWWKTWRSR